MHRKLSLGEHTQKIEIFFTACQRKSRIEMNYCKNMVDGIAVTIAKITFGTKCVVPRDCFMQNCTLYFFSKPPRNSLLYFQQTNTLDLNLIFYEQKSFCSFKGYKRRLKSRKKLTLFLINPISLVPRFIFYGKSGTSQKNNFHAEKAVLTTNVILLQYRSYRNQYRTTAFSVDPYMTLYKEKNSIEF